jgi:hypothetical protein
MTIRLAFGHVDTDFDDRRRDQDVDLAGSEGGHHGTLVAGPQAAMHQPDAQAGEFGAERGVGIECGLQFEFGGLLDQGTDPVACRPPATTARTAAITSSRRLSENSRVRTGDRPGGSSSITETSRSA